jgi:hypothetical protein
MKNSKLVERYSVDGSLCYAPYNNDPRVSHSHGRSTGLTSLLSFYVAGIHLTSVRGQAWKIVPQPGDLAEIDFESGTSLESFSTLIISRSAKSFRFRALLRERTPFNQGITSLLSPRSSTHGLSFSCFVWKIDEHCRRSNECEEKTDF